MVFTSLLMGDFGLQVGVIAVGSIFASWSSSRLQRLDGPISGVSGQRQAASSTPNRSYQWSAHGNLPIGTKHYVGDVLEVWVWKKAIVKAQAKFDDT